VIAQLRIYKKDAELEKKYAKRKRGNRYKEEVANEETINDENFGVQVLISVILRRIVICASDHVLPDFFKVILT